MCSIFGILELKTDFALMKKKAIECSNLMKHRGPDYFGIYEDKYIILIHNRLSIVDVKNGAQPLYNDNKTHVLAVNGEIYNYHKLYSKLSKNYKFQTNSDCEVILALYQEKGINFLNDLQGMFAFILYDSVKKIYLIGRDHIGIIPLYIGMNKHNTIFIASEMKALIPICCSVKEFPPGSYLSNIQNKIYRYWQPNWIKYKNVKNNITYVSKLKNALEKSVKSHLMCDVPYGVLLSGGIDSSIISAITNKLIKNQNNFKEKNNIPLHSFAIGLRGSPDLKAAKFVADYLGTLHNEIHFTIQEGLDNIRNVIYHIETYDVTTIRASTPMYLMSNKIKEMGIKMILSGEGADEIFGGYLYFHKAPNPKEFHEENIRKLLSLHMFDCMRVNKAMSAWGIEARVPFLDKEFLDISMRINPKDKMCGSNGKIEKYILRKCFSSYIPDIILWRQKEQFSDGVGYSWIKSLKKLAENQVTDEQLKSAKLCFPFNTPQSKEAYLYRKIFDELFPISGAAECVPGGPSIACSSNKAIKWDKDFENINDPSGRSVNVHSSYLNYLKHNIIN
ncbi:asparagine synthase B [Candidatus Pantoea edessiphila]|uniref:asparagine synthase (glutamine-hydrolyzing) n=1 Tax=Candidatus Pantoea edessiphila TaxID=2044610 RepID=A0A2P5T0G9_9GAMM|nr:asparagine synthase B [Candidatus Pantoea edessiphila]PPI88050.1 asparagine synthase B [Candidatus Pantoea edessiphila]